MSLGAGRSVNSGVIAVLIMCYLGLLLGVLRFREDIAPIGLIFAQTAIFTILAPALLHGSIAGERERRSWDILMAAPVSKAQIVAGKFLGALTVLGIGFALFLFPTLITLAFYRGHTPIVPFLGAEAISASFGILLCALTIFLSARARRSFMALGTTLTTLLLTLLAIPGLVATLTMGNDVALEFACYFNPFWALVALVRLSDGSHISNGMPALVYGLPQVAFYLGFSAILLAWSINTLIFADNDVKFKPRKASDA